MFVLGWKKSISLYILTKEWKSFCRICVKWSQIIARGPITRQAKIVYFQKDFSEKHVYIFIIYLSFHKTILPSLYVMCVLCWHFLHLLYFHCLLICMCMCTVLSWRTLGTNFSKCTSLCSSSFIFCDQIVTKSQNWKNVIISQGWYGKEDDKKISCLNFFLRIQNIRKKHRIRFPSLQTYLKSREEHSSGERFASHFDTFIRLLLSNLAIRSHVFVCM